MTFLLYQIKKFTQYSSVSSHVRRPVKCHLHTSSRESPLWTSTRSILCQFSSVDIYMPVMSSQWEQSGRCLLGILLCQRMLTGWQFLIICLSLASSGEIHLASTVCLKVGQYSGRSPGFVLYVWLWIIQTSSQWYNAPRHRCPWWYQWLQRAASRR